MLEETSRLRLMKKNYIWENWLSDIIGLCAARLAGCKILSILHGWSQNAGFKLRIYEKIDRFVFRFMDFICPLSEDLFESIRYCSSPEKIKLILNGVDIDEIDMQPVMQRANSERFRIGYIGQLIERKNLQKLIKSLKLLFKDDIYATLTIVGDGPEREACEVDS